MVITKRGRGTKNTSGRKHISKSGTVKHRGQVIAVNAKGSGVYTATIKKSFEQFDRGLDCWRRQIMVIAQLHLGYSQSTNKVMTLLLKRLRYRFAKELGINEFGFHWCRELERGEGAHYHLYLWLDGDKYRTSHSITPRIREAWENLGGSIGSTGRPYHFVNDEQSRLDALYHLSYISKGKGKGNRPVQTKDHGMSRLKPLGTIKTQSKF